MALLLYSRSEECKLRNSRPTTCNTNTVRHLISTAHSCSYSLPQYYTGLQHVLGLMILRLDVPFRSPANKVLYTVLSTTIVQFRMQLGFFHDL